MMLIGLASKYLLPALIVITISSVGFSYYQTRKVWALDNEKEILLQNIEQFKKGSELAVELRTKNKELQNELATLKEELNNVEGIETLLPSDLIDFFARMRERATSE